MLGQIDEEVLESFRVSDDDFRDLDSITRAHSESVKYYVYRGSAVGGYETEDVEVLLKERNVSGAQIESVILQAIGSEKLKFNIEFRHKVVINGQCEDRAKLVLLATEISGLIKDRMKGGLRQRRNILQVIAVIFFLLGYLGFQQYQNLYANRYNAEHNALLSRLEASNQQSHPVAVSPQTLLSQATSALSKHNLTAEIDVLLQQQMGEWRSEIAANAVKPIPASILDSTLPSWATSFWLSFGVGCIVAAVAVSFTAYLILPSGRSVFLIGDEKRRQTNSDQRRRNIRWVVIVGFFVALAAGYVTSWR